MKPDDDFLAAAAAFDLKRALAAPATRPSRHTEWSNAESFVSEGYIARVLRQTCKSCGAVAEHTEGIFHAERKPGAAARRLTLLPRGAQWPVQEHLPLEVTESTTDWCPPCLRMVGFDAERPAGRDWLKGTVQ